MGPQEITNREQLAAALSALREARGLSVRELARRLAMPTATVGDYVSGRHLPGPRQLELYTAILRECGVPGDAVPAWIDALLRVRRGSDGRHARGPAPYRGLEAFDVQDAAWFFGREAITRELLGRLRAMLATDAGPSAWPLLLVGPSGSGKSSLLRAGLGAQVAAGALGPGWELSVLTPGTWDAGAPLSPPGERDHERRRLVLVDQLEELFGLPQPVRERFLAKLGHLRPPGSATVAALRADFYAEAVAEPALFGAVRDSQLLVGPLTRTELRAAIVEPARAAAAAVDESLVELLLSEMAPAEANGPAHAAGALPLLSHALLSTWERSPHARLGVEDYRAAGGLLEAVSHSAESVYQALTAGEQELARRIFCRLVRVEDDGPLTRRRVARRELAELVAEAGQDPSPGPLEQRRPDVLERFIAARLLSAQEETVEISHETLMVAWPRLAEWLVRDRAGLRLHRALTRASNTWAETGEDDGELLRGARLSAIADWVQEGDHRGELNATERRYLDTSLARAQAERAAERRRLVRARQAAGLIGALALLAVALAVVALSARRAALNARDRALSREVAVESAQIGPANPSLAMQLAVVAFGISPTTQARSTLIDATAGPMPSRLLGPIGLTGLSSDAGGHLFSVLSVASGQVRLLALHSTGLRTAGPFPGGPPGTDTVALSGDGRLLASGAPSGAVELWRLSAHRGARLLARLSVSGGVNDVTFSPGGGRLAAVGDGGAVRQWPLGPAGEPGAPVTLDLPGHPSLDAVAYSPTGRDLAAAGAAGTLAIWTLGRSGPRLITRVTVAPTQLTALAFSPDGSTLAAGAHDLTVWHWRLGANGVPRLPGRPLHGFANWVDSLTFSHDGRFLAAGSSDNTIRIWRTGSWAPEATLEDVSPVDGLAFTAGDRALVSVDENGTTRLWPLPPPGADVTIGPPYTIDYTANGRELTAITGGPHGQVEIWNTADSWRPRRVGSITMPRSFGPVAAVGAMTPDGRLLAVGDVAGDVQEYRLTASGHARTVGPLITGAEPLIEQIDYSPDGRLLSVGDDGGRVRLYDVGDPARPRLLSVLDRPGRSGPVLGVSYSPNGRLIAVGCADDRVWLWDIADPARPRRLAVLGGFHSAVYSTVISPDGRTLIAGGADDTVRLWSIVAPAHPRSLGPPLTGPGDNVYQVAVSPSGLTLGAATTGGQVWLWGLRDRRRPRLLATLAAAPGLLYDLTFSPDGQTLVAGSSTERMTFWHYRPAAAIARICVMAGAPITRVEWSRYVPGARYSPPCR